MRKIVKLVFLTSLFASPAAVLSDIIKLEAGDTAKAEDLNHNFNVIDDRIEGVRGEVLQAPSPIDQRLRVMDGSNPSRQVGEYIGLAPDGEPYLLVTISIEGLDHFLMVYATPDRLDTRGSWPSGLLRYESMDCSGQAFIDAGWINPMGPEPSLAVHRGLGREGELSYSTVEYDTKVSANIRSEAQYSDEQLAMLNDGVPSADVGAPCRPYDIDQAQPGSSWHPVMVRGHLYDKFSPPFRMTLTD